MEWGENAPRNLGIILFIALLSTIVWIGVLFSCVDIDNASQSQIIQFVISGGLIGSLVHVVSSYIVYMGNKNFVNSWIWWYAFKPMVGIGIALIFYFLVSTNLESKLIDEKGDLFTLFTLAALVGLFNDKAVMKLEEIFNTIFKPEDKREDKVNSTLPVIEKIDPNSIPKSTPTDLKIIGIRFPADAQCFVNNVNQQNVIRVSDKELSVKQVNLNLPAASQIISVQVIVKSASLGLESKSIELSVT